MTANRRIELDWAAVAMWALLLALLACMWCGGWLLFGWMARVVGWI